MLKRRLVVVAVAGLSLVVASFAAGQITKKRKVAPSTVQTTTPRPAASPMGGPTNSNASFQGDVGEGTGIRTKKPLGKTQGQPPGSANGPPLNPTNSNTSYQGDIHDGNGIRTKKPMGKRRGASPGNANLPTTNPNSNVAPSSVNANTPNTFVGGSDDGQSIKRKQPRKRRRD